MGAGTLWGKQANEMLQQEHRRVKELEKAKRAAEEERNAKLKAANRAALDHMEAMRIKEMEEDRMYQKLAIETLDQRDRARAAMLDEFQRTQQAKLEACNREAKSRPLKKWMVSRAARSLARHEFSRRILCRRAIADVIRRSLIRSRPLARIVGRLLQPSGAAFDRSIRASRVEAIGPVSTHRSLVLPTPSLPPPPPPPFAAPLKPPISISMSPSLTTLPPHPPLPPQTADDGRTRASSSATSRSARRCWTCRRRRARERRRS